MCKQVCVTGVQSVGVVGTTGSSSDTGFGGNVIRRMYPLLSQYLGLQLANDSTMNSSLQNKGAGDGQATIPQPFLHKPSFVCQLASAFLRVRGDVSYKKSSQVQIQNLTMTMRLMILRDINHQLLMMTRPPQHFDVMILGIRLLLMKLLLLMKYQTA